MRQRCPPEALGSGKGDITDYWKAGQESGTGPIPEPVLITDDGNCDDAAEQDHLMFVFNAGDNPDSNGFADTNGVAELPALVRVLKSVACEELQNYEWVWAREFRYDEPRQRYLVADIDLYASHVNDTWTDYVGDYPVADFVNSSGNAHETVRYDWGLTEHDMDSGETVYLRNDLIGTVEARCDDDDSPTFNDA